MHILVLGSSGQIGRPLTQHLRNHGHTVIEFDILNSQEEDLRLNKNSKLMKLIRYADFVYFLAFDIGGSFYMKQYQDTSSFISNNMKIMDTVFSALELQRIPFIFASSQMSNMSYSTYGRLKAVGESWTRSLNGMVVKFWNVYGVEHDKNKAHVITDFLRMAKETGEIHMKSDGMEYRQFLHTKDCSRGLEILMNKFSEIDLDKELTLTSFRWTSILEVANIISRLYGNIPVIRGLEGDTVQRDATNQPDDYVLDFWQPKVSVEGGIKIVNDEMFGD